MNKRISSIELLRFVFMSIIVVWHSFGQTFFKHGYLPVDFFFILSGVFIYEAVTRKNTPPRYQANLQLEKYVSSYRSI